MTKFIAIAATILTGLVVLPERAEAGRVTASFTYQSGRTACGCPVYTRRYVAGYDCYRRPVYRYVAVPVAHRCAHHARGYHYVPSRPVHRPVYAPAPRYGYVPHYRPAPAPVHVYRGRTCR